MRVPAKENTLAMADVDIRARTCRRRTRLDSDLPNDRSRDQPRTGEHPREVRWTVTPCKGKDSVSSDSRKTFIILMF